MNRFQTTRWGLIATAASDAPAQARPALDALCRAYRPPVLAYVCRCGYSTADAEDLVQAFFLRFLERAWYARAAPQRGRFRNLVLVSLRRFLADEHARKTALRNGGQRCGSEAMEELAWHGETPEQAFDRAWMGTLLARALARLQEEWWSAGKQLQFSRLAPLLADAPTSGELQAIASELGVARNALAVQLHRMRARLRQLARLELLQTVNSREALEEELRELRSALAEEP
ncbi:MAG: sigma-70 family RNA polymerase sigma factor [Pseudomonadota bacterium]